MLFIIILFVASGASAQQKIIPRDTSFTIHSAYVKEKKKYPFIEIAEPPIPNNISIQRDIVYTSIKQRELHLDVYYPKNKRQKYPAVLLIHGGGWKSGDKSQNEAMALQLASKGYVAVTAEYRLSTEAQYPAALYDLRQAIRWMRTNAGKYGLNKNKIAVLGVSAGGQLAALLGTTYDHKKVGGRKIKKRINSIQAIIDIDGILAFKHPESAEGKMAAEWLGGTYEENPVVWQEASALTHVGKNTPPTLFINSSNPRFHAGQNDFINKLQPYRIYHEVHTIPDTPHTFWLFHPWFRPTVDIVSSFLNRIFK
ncbi:MAG TPA: alpha/beta hydrolase [Segetibacter sp.]